jgi:hypothetical protein
MAATRVIEEERGSYTGAPRNPHQGYYAGDFSGRPVTVIGLTPASQDDPLFATAASSGWF